MKKYTFEKSTIAAFLVTVFFLGVNFVAVKFSNKELSPFSGASLRFIVASFILFGIIKIRHIPLPKGKELVGAFLYGLLAFGFNIGLLYLALTKVTAALASIVFATIPLITLIFATLVGIEKFTIKGLAGAVIVAFGIGLVFSEQLKLNVTYIYLIYIILAAMCAAASTIAIKYFPKSHPISTNAVAMLIGGALLLFLSIAFHESFHMPHFVSTWLALIWLIVSSIIAYVLLVFVLSRWPASTTSYSSVLYPLVTVSVASLIAGERVSIYFLTGGVIVLIGIYIGVLTNQADKKRSDASQAEIKDL